ncbi:alpha/beta hydrolase family protein [Corallococcus exiguus]|uniref:alpha/beta hydrolase family protein n=1 Tax=Corallococcus exiguus TaxID=83462 RepID=UPI0015610D9A|nr:chlorophyllase [Corallococcus exiguus]NRD42892.1 chlorophyllase [Corallococcus exiguus]
MSKSIPRNEAPAPVVSVRPVVLPAPGRGADLEVRVSAPVTGSGLPIIVFAHGHGSSSDGYLPLAHDWAARGFVVIQPTFLDSRTFGLGPEDPRSPWVWKFRIEDVTRVLDHLDVIEASVPGLTGRVDRNRLAMAGHSFGAQTTAMLLGARIRGPDGQLGEDLSDPRIKVGVLLCAGGRGGDALSPLAREHFPYLNQVYEEMTTPTLVVAGDQDHSPLTVLGPEWFTDAYTLSPGPKSLLTLFGAEHMLGGISGDLVTETTDENPARVAAVQRLTWAYLHEAFYPDKRAWAVACEELMASPTPQGRVESKPRPP